MNRTQFWITVSFIALVLGMLLLGIHLIDIGWPA